MKKKNFHSFCINLDYLIIEQGFYITVHNYETQACTGKDFSWKQIIAQYAIIRYLEQGK